MLALVPLAVPLVVLFAVPLVVLLVVPLVQVPAGFQVLSDVQRVPGAGFVKHGSPDYQRSCLIFVMMLVNADLPGVQCFV